MAWRILNRDGSFNVAKEKNRQKPWEDIYHSLLVLPWWQFFLFIFSFYFLVNLLFGFLYYSAGPNALEGIGHHQGLSRYVECVFFSVQTLATIGYGKINPIGLVPNLIVSVEALMGLLCVALITGILFARFARPTARVAFSKNAIIAPHDGKLTLLMRLANKRYNQIVDADVSMVLVHEVSTAEGQSFRMPYDLKLVRPHTSLFALSWTLMHIIDEQSPLFGKNRADLEKMDAEIMVSLIGIDDTFASTIHARVSYSPENILWNHRYGDMLSKLPDGRIHVNIHKIDEVVPL